MPRIIRGNTLSEVAIIIPQVFYDERGHFFESFSNEWFRNNVSDTTFIQDNESFSIKHVARGLHYQLPPYAQSKLVRVVKGEVYDYAVDIRKGSPTFGKYECVHLTEHNHHQFFIPRGFAHGFIALTDDVIFQYKVDNPYNKESERSILFTDPEFDFFGGNLDIILSEKDKVALPLSETNDCDLFDYNKHLY